MRTVMPFAVRYAETDMMGVVHHANYLLYLEDARTDFLEQIGFPYARIEQEGLMSPVVDLQCSYGRPLVYGDRPLVRTRVVLNGQAKTVYAYEIFKSEDDLAAEKPCCTASSTHCVVEAATFRPVSIKRRLPELYARYLDVLEP